MKRKETDEARILMSDIGFFDERGMAELKKNSKISC